MIDRPTVLLAVEPPLLADLVKRALEPSVEVIPPTAPLAADRDCDVAVVHGNVEPVTRARHVVRVGPASDFVPLVAAVCELCGVTRPD